MKKKILFLIHDLGHGGAEKVLVNLVNNMDPDKFDITVMALFGGGVNEQFLKPHIHFRRVFPKAFPGNSHVMKLLSPRQLHCLFIREQYDIEISYLEGPSARIISGCPHKDTKLVSWIHCTMQSEKDFARGFRSAEEARDGYGRMDTMAFVCRTVRDAFLAQYPYNGQTEVLYNTNESDKIQTLAAEDVELPGQGFHWCSVGRLIPIKAFDRMIRIQKRLREDGYQTQLCILGEGQLKQELEKLAAECGVTDSMTFLGYQTNPYKYVAKCDLFVCSSHSEGFSTAATEALIVGTPVCTVEVSGMKEMLGENNEWGIVTENNEDALYQGIRQLLDDEQLLSHYKEKAAQRGKTFSMENTVNAVEEMLLETEKRVTAMIEYSVIIRTIGKAGEKYQNLLNSIASLDPQPKEVIVVLPEGYELPAERLGWETFYFSPKGMVAQRMYGIEQCKAPYALVCDDDVSFEPDFVKKLHEPIEKGMAGLTAGPLYSFLPQKGIHAMIDAVSGAAVPTIFHKDRYVSVLRTAGYSYNRHLRPEMKRFYGAQSLAGTCFYADVAALRQVDFTEEKWIDANGYSAYEDQTMFYKALLRGVRSVVVADAHYVHQDAKTSRKNKTVVTRCLIINRIIFWHRFIYSMECSAIARAWARFCFAYRMGWLRLWALIDWIRGRNRWEDVHLIFQACKDGWKYVKSAEYAALPAVHKGEL